MNIAEIAKMAGVSSAAVSRYFNNGYVSEEKREAIRRVVEETGYRPSVQAQTLRTHRTKMIGVILPRIASTAIGRMVSGILTELEASGYQLLLADTQNNEKKELEYLSVFNEKQVDGVIFIATVFTPAHQRALKSMALPVVLLSQQLNGYHCVYFDDYHSIYDMTSIFLKQGLKKLGFISVFHQDRAAGLDRYRGYCDAVQEAGLSELKERYVVSGFTLKDGYEKTRELVERFGMPEAIVCATDTIAIGAMQYCKEQGIRIPSQVQISGHGDTTQGTVTTPSLTTVHYSYEEGGMIAARMLLEQLEKKIRNVREVKLGFSIVQRESAGAIGLADSVAEFAYGTER